MQTVPRRPAGGSQRAKRRATPSGVFRVPATKLSGTGLAGIETSFMKAFGRAAASAYNSPRASLNSFSKTYFYEPFTAVAGYLAGQHEPSHIQPAQAIQGCAFSARPIWAGLPHVASQG